MPKQKQSRPSSESPMAKTVRILLAAIFLLGLGLRLWHIQWGLPRLYEEAFPFTVAFGFWNQGNPGFNFDLHFFNYPALTIYLQFVLQLCHYFIGHLWGSYATPEAFVRAYALDPTIFIIVARATTVVFDAGLMVFLFLTARRIFGERTALVAVLLFAINPLLVRHAHFVNVDTPLAFFGMVTIYFFSLISKEPKRIWYILAGLSIGAATSAKYTGAILLPLLLVAHLVRAKSLQEGVRLFKEKEWIIAAAIAIATFVVTNPYIFINTSEFLSDFTFEQYHTGAGHLGLDTSESTLHYYLFGVIPLQFGWIVAAFILVGMALAGKENMRQFLVVAGFPLLYIGIISFWEMRADRYLLPAFPQLILFASVGIVKTCNFVSNKLLQSRKLHPLAAHSVPLVLAILCSFTPVKSMVTYHRGLDLPDTREIAEQWMQKNIPMGSAVALAPFGLEVKTDRYVILPVPFHPVMTDQTAPFYKTELYEDLDCFIGSSFDYGRYLRDTARYQPFIEFYNTLRSDWRLVQEIAPVEGQNGPTIWFYQPTNRMDTIPNAVISRILTIQNENAPRFLGKLGVILKAKGDLKKSEQLLTAVVAFDPQNATGHKELAYLYFQREDYVRTLKEIEIYLKLQPNDAEMLSMEGSALLRLGKNVEAIDRFERALQLNNRIEQAYQELSILYASLGDSVHLVAVLKRYLEILPPRSQKAKLLEAHLSQLTRERASHQ